MSSFAGRAWPRGCDWGTFDYIIAHDVYVRGDEAERERMLAICRDHLAPHGVALVDYPTYPGRMREMFRAMMRYEARQATSAEDAAVKAHTFLDFLDASLPPTGYYERLVRAEVAPLVRQPDAALRQEIETTERPLYFRQFMADAERQGLQLLGDFALGIRLCDYLGPEIETLLSHLTTDKIEQEQYRDIVRNRARTRRSFVINRPRCARRRRRPISKVCISIAG